MTFDPAKYQPPRVSAGDWLEDELLGLVQVGGYHDGQIPWPYRRRTGAHSLILTSTLAEAVRTEAAQDIMAWFGVSEGTVWGWRKALGVTARNNPGTQRRYKELAASKLTPEAAARGRAKAAQPEARAKALDTIAKGMRRRKPHPNTIHWTPKMDAVLGTMPDEQAARALGISKTKVSVRRRYLKIPSYRSTTEWQWTPEHEARLGTAFDSVLAKEWGIHRSTVTMRRQALGIPAFSKT